MKKKTLLILGAGASQPYKFPTGFELRNLIAGRDGVRPEVMANLQFRNLEAITTWLESEFEQRGEPKAFTRQFRKTFNDADPFSIDQFLHRHKSVSETLSIGCQMISLFILRSEQKENLYGGWYSILLNELLPHGDVVRAGQLSIVTFNYDRSLEFYLYRCFKNYLGPEGHDPIEMLSRIEIIHTYGDLGPLGLEFRDAQTVGYGEVPRAGRAAQNIRLIGDRAQQSAQSRIQELLQEKDRHVIFLGFGFDSLNLQLLGGADLRGRGIASCYGLSKSRINDANQHFLNLQWGDQTDKIDEVLHKFGVW